MLSVNPNSLLHVIQTLTPTSSAHNSDVLHPRDTTTRYAAGPASDSSHGRAASDRTTIVIRSRTRDGRPREALALFRETLADGALEPDELSVTTVLKCCTCLGVVRPAKEVHGFMIRNSGGKVRTCSSESSLVDCYAKCGRLADAREVFDQMSERDVVAWTTMLMAFADKDDCEEEMMDLFVGMLQENVTPNWHTFSVILRRATLEQGKQLHSLILKLGLDLDAFVGSSLINVYGRNGSSHLAELVFNRILHKDVVCYNSLIAWYGRTGILERLVSVFTELCLAGLLPNQSTCLGLLNGCASCGFTSLSKQFHAQIIIRGFGLYEIVQGAIIDMYAKCGDLESARVAFDSIDIKQNAILWNSMINGYSKHGHTKEALRIFNLMELASVRPDHITFICLLSACSHSGLVDTGLRLLHSMIEQYGIPASDKHLSCIVDLLGRAGKVNEAFELLRSSSYNVGPSAWGAILNSCRMCGNVEIGEVAASRLFEIEPECSASYIALAGLYSEKGRFDEATAVRKMMDDRSIIKETGYSWIDVGGSVHKFRARDGMEGINHLEVNLMCDTLNASICDCFDLELLAMHEDYCT